MLKIILLKYVFFINIVIYIILCIFGNIDASFGKHILYMDESVTYDGVYKIINRINADNLIDNVINVGDYRYGQIYFNINALIGTVPSELFGEQGQIISIRMFQPFLILGSLIAFSFGILKNWESRVLFCIIILVMPYTAYYSTMPKPEPLQIFFFSIFFVLFYRKKFNFGIYWILLGLFFSVKISSLTTTILLIITSTIILIKNKELLEINKLYYGIISFFLGILIGLPFLYKPILQSIILILVLILINKNLKITKIVYLLCFPIILFIFYRDYEFNTWIKNLVIYMRHPADNPIIGFIDWVIFLKAEYFFSSIFLSTYLLIFIGYLLYRSGLSMYEYGFNRKLTAGILIITCAILNLLLISFNVKRIWGFYLWPSMFMLTAGIFIIIDEIYYNKIRKKY